MPLDATHTIRSGIAWRTTLSNFYRDLKKSHPYFFEIWHHFSNGYNFWPSEKISTVSVPFERESHGEKYETDPGPNRSVGPELERFENPDIIPKMYGWLHHRIGPEIEGPFSRTVRIGITDRKTPGTPVAAARNYPRNSRLLQRKKS